MGESIHRTRLVGNCKHFALGQRQDLYDFTVVQLKIVICRVDLERDIALADQRRKLLPQNLRIRLRDNQVESVVITELAPVSAEHLGADQGGLRIALSMCVCLR